MSSTTTEITFENVKEEPVLIKEEINNELAEIDLVTKDPLTEDINEQKHNVELEECGFVKTEYDSDLEEDVPDLIEAENYVNYFNNEPESDSDPDTPRKYKCNLCDKRFKTSQTLYNHKRKRICDKYVKIGPKSNDIFIKTESDDVKISIKKQKFKCTACGKTLTGITSIQRHMLTHTGEKNYTCHTCKRSFGLKSSLKKHLASHREKDYKCSICDKILTSEKFLKNHEQQHIDENKFVCDICDCRFGLESSLKRHQITHKEKQHMCKFCNKFFTTERFLENHLPKHDEEHQYFCKVCNASFGLESSLKRHQYSHKEKQYRCKVCQKDFTTKKYLLNHQIQHNEIKEFSCDICGATFGLETNLRRHEVKHKADFRKYSCEFCPRVFSQLSSMNGHLQIHLKEIEENEKKSIEQIKLELAGMFICKICNACFEQESSLKRHQYSHNAFKCDVCGKKYATESHLDRHRQLQHFDLKWFPCSLCGDSFNLLNDFREHINAAHSEDVKKHGCDFCSRTFSEIDALQRHLHIHKDLIVEKEKMEVGEVSLQIHNDIIVETEKMEVGEVNPQIHKDIIVEKEKTEVEEVKIEFNNLNESSDNG